LQRQLTVDPQVNQKGAKAPFFLVKAFVWSSVSRRYTDGARMERRTFVPVALGAPRVSKSALLQQAGPGMAATTLP
jgi:hypothetical protein